MSVLGVADAVFWLKTLVVGAVSGVLSGMFGIGGGMITTPAIRLLLGGSAIVAVATPLPIIIPTAITGAIGYVRREIADVRAGMIVGGSGALAAVLGAYLTRWIGGSTLMIATGALVVYMAADMLVAGRRAAPGAHAPGAAASASEEGPLLVSDDDAPTAAEVPLSGSGAVSEPGQASACIDSDSQVSACGTTGDSLSSMSVTGDRLLSPKGAPTCAAASATAAPPTTASPTAAAAFNLALLGLGAGLYSGLLGLGGGFVIVPALMRFFGFGTKRAIGTSLVAIAILSVPGTITHALLGHIDWRLAVALSLTVIPGAWLGARVTAAASERHVRAAFAIMLAVVGVV
ncbi:MAG TPA: sulfite exporter TauE/SafE family protein, partial [Thermoleophilia bacterium]